VSSVVNKESFFANLRLGGDQLPNRIPSAFSVSSVVNKESFFANLRLGGDQNSRPDSLCVLRVLCGE
jgi:hypothetical protein